MLLDGRIDLEIELLVPKSSGWKNPFKKITVVELGKIGSKVEKIYMAAMVFPIYVTKKKAIGVDLAGAVPIWGVSNLCTPWLYKRNISWKFWPT